MSDDRTQAELVKLLRDLAKEVARQERRRNSASAKIGRWLGGMGRSIASGGWE